MSAAKRVPNVRYHELRPTEILARRATKPIAFLPVGTIEWHGEHLPVGLDGLKAERLAELAAEQCGGFLFPTCWYGEPRSFSHMDADQDDSPKVRARLGIDAPHSHADELQRFEELIRRLLIQLADMQMRAICILCGHYPMRDWLDRTVTRFNEAGYGARAVLGTEKTFSAPHCGGVDHAGKWETSYLLRLRPELVAIAPAETSPGVGILGDDPRTASAELGARATAQTVQGMVAAAEALLR